MSLSIPIQFENAQEAARVASVGAPRRLAQQTTGVSDDRTHVRNGDSQPVLRNIIFLCP
jgi:hypothetical protein